MAYLYSIYLYRKFLKLYDLHLSSYPLGHVHTPGSGFLDFGHFI